MPHVRRRHHSREPKELDRGAGPVSSAQSDDGRRRSQEAWRARFSLDDSGDQALPRGLRSAAENREVRPGAVRSDDGAIPALGSQSVVADVRISGGITDISGKGQWCRPVCPRIICPRIIENGMGLGLGDKPHFSQEREKWGTWPIGDKRHCLKRFEGGDHYLIGPRCHFSEKRRLSHVTSKPFQDRKS